MSVRRVEIQDLTFTTNGQSLWRGGSAATFSDNRFLGTSWNTSRNFGIGPLGLDASTDGRVGLQSNFRVQGGTVSASLPTDIWLDVPTTAKAGDTVTIRSGFSVDPRATFTTLSPSANYNLQLIIDAAAQLQGRVGPFSRRLLGFDIDRTVNLLRLDSNNLQYDIPINAIGGAISLRAPNLNINGSRSASNQLTGSRTDNFLSANADLVTLATRALNAIGVPVPPLRGSAGINIGIAGGSVNWNVLSAVINAGLGVQQNLGLTANRLAGTLNINGVNRPFTVGQDFSFVMPGTTGNNLNIRATVGLDANLSNRTSLNLNSNLNLSALEGSATVTYPDPTWRNPFRRGSRTAGFGPLFQRNVPLGSGNIATLYNESFGLGGFAQRNFDFNVPVVV